MGSRQQQVRRGFSILEGCLALGVVLVTLATTALLVARSHVARTEQSRRQCAQFAAGNALQRILALPYDEWTQERLDARRFELDGVPSGRITIQVAPVESPEGRRVRVEVDWPERDGEPARAVRLTAYRWRNEEALR